MAERWRKPITAAAIEADERYVWETPDGTVHDHYDVTFSQDDWNRINEGRACLRCWETQEEAFPSVERHLPGCVYAPDGIKRRQRDDIAVEFEGAKWIGPSKNLADAIAEDDERREKLRRDFGINEWVPTVPRWIKV